MIVTETEFKRFVHMLWVAPNGSWAVVVPNGERMSLRMQELLLKMGAVRRGNRSEDDAYTVANKYAIVFRWETRGGFLGGRTRVLRIGSLGTKAIFNNKVSGWEYSESPITGLTERDNMAPEGAI